MKQVNFQFHARRKEILSFVFDIVKENNLYILIAELFPEFKYNIVNDEEEILDDVSSNMIVLSKNYPIIDYNNYNDFCTKNNGQLIIRLGEESDNIIRESCIGCISENDIDKLWRDIINAYKRRMLKGAWGINPLNGNRSYYKNHYYTEAIKKAYEDGGELHAFAGNCIFEIC